MAWRLGVLCTAVVIAGCSTGLRYGATAALPACIRERVAVVPTDSSSEADGSGDGSHHSLRLHISERRRLRGDPDLRFITLPLHQADAGPMWSTRGEARSPYSRKWMSVEFLIDSGGEFFLSLSLPAARRLQPWLSKDVGVARARTVAGDSLVSSGVLDTIIVGDVLAVSPAGVNVRHTDAPHAEPVLGIEFLEMFAGAIFDWDGGRVTLISADSISGSSGTVGEWETLRTDVRWTSVPWAGARTRTLSAASGERVERRPIRTAEARINGRKRIALLDTGTSGDLVTWIPTDVQDERWRGRASAGGQWIRTLVGKSKGPVQCGQAVWKQVEVDYIPDRPPPAGFDIIIGAGLLQRQPVWMDFERDAVRFWMSTDPIPLPASR